MDENEALSTDGDSPSLDLSGAENSAVVDQPENTDEAGESTDSSAADDTDDEDGEHEPFVPYDRFKEVNSKFRNTQKELEAARAAETELAEYRDLINQVKELGGMTALQQQMAASLQEQQEQADAARQASIRKEVDDLVEAGSLSPELAEEMTAIKTQLASLTPLAQNLQQQKQESAITTGIARLKTQFPEMDESFVRLSMEVGDDPVAAARSSHERITAAISRYNGQKAAATKNLPPTPGGAGGPTGSMPTPPDPTDREAFAKYLKKVEGHL